MAFDNAFLSRVDVGLNTSFTVNYTSGAASAQGGLGLFQYNGKAVGDAVGTIDNVDYFLPAIGNFQVGSIIFVTGTDASAMYLVSAVTQPNGSGLGGTISITAY